jgi:hypothetical protein
MRAAHRLADRRYLPVLVGALIVIFVSACGTGAVATASPAPTAAPTAAPTEAPSVAASVAPGASAKVDPAVGLNIAAPYTLAPLAAALETQMETAMAAAMGSLASIVQIGARTAEKDGVTQSYVIVMRLPGVPITGAGFLDSVAGGAAGQTGTIVKTTIGGKDVRVITAGANVSMVLILGDRVLFVGGATQDIETGVVTALVSANPS